MSGPSPSAAATASTRSRTSSRLARTWARTSVNGRPWPGRHRRASSGSTSSRQRGTRRPGPASGRSRRRARRGRAGGRRRSAAGARAGAGRRARARGRASRTPARCRGRSRPRRPGTSVAVGLDHVARCPSRSPARAPRRPAAARRARRSGARPRAAAPAPPRGRRGCAHVLLVGVHPQLAAGALDDRRRLAVVVGVGVGADEQADVLEPQADLVQRALELGERAGPCIPVSTRTIPSPAATAQALPCGTPGQGSGSRRRQTPGSTRSPRPSSRLRAAGPSTRKIVFGEGSMPEAIADVHRPRGPDRGRRPQLLRAPSAARDVDAMVACWVPGRIGRFVGDRDARRARRRPRVLRRDLRARSPTSRSQVSRPVRRGRPRARALAGHAAPSPAGRLPRHRAHRRAHRHRGLRPRDACATASSSRHRRLRQRPRLRAPARAAPPGRVAAEQRLTRSSTRARASAAARGRPEPVADGVWLIAGGAPLKSINVYLIEDEGGVTVFDAGIQTMAPAIAAAAAAHRARSRGSCSATPTPTTAAPRPALRRAGVLPRRDRADAEGDGGAHYFDYAKLGFPPARFARAAAHGSWDGGPVESPARWPRATRSPASGRPPARPRAGDDRAVARVRPPGAANDCFAMFDATPAAGGRPPSPTPRSTSTEVPRARDASSPRSSRRRAGPATTAR